MPAGNGQTMLELLIAVSIAALITLLITRLLGLFLVQGDSMSPTLQEGDWVLARRLPANRPVGKGVIVILRKHPILLIKRVLAVPGEVLPEEVCATESRLPEGRYFLAGDNLALRPEQRWVGPIETEQLWGSAWLVVWPLHRIRRLGRRVGEGGTDAEVK